MNHDLPPRRWSVPGYRSVRSLGAGATGDVMEAVELRTHQSVAIKYLNDDFTGDAARLVAFREEARLLQELDCPQVARLYEYHQTAAGAAIVMELVHGASLWTLLRREGALAPEGALHILKGSLLGLAAAHRAGVVHRDYKPANVLITMAGESKLVDFGVAVRRGAASSCAGTPAYMAPEQWRGADCSPATDVYAATIALFECMTGDRPYVGANPHELMVQHVSAPIPYDCVPDSFRSLVRDGLAKRPEERIPDARTFLEFLERAALAAHGPDWEERGKRALAAAVALVPLLLRTVPLDGSGSDAAVTALSSTVTTELGPVTTESSTVTTELPADPPIAAPRAGSALPRQRRRRVRAVSAAAGACIVMAVVASVVAASQSDSPTPGPRASMTAAASAPLPAPAEHTAVPTASGGGPPTAGTTATATNGVMPTNTPTTHPSPPLPGNEKGSAEPSRTTSAAEPTPTRTRATQAAASTPPPPSSSSPAPTGQPSPPPAAVASVEATALSVADGGRATATFRVRTTNASPVALTVRWYDAPARASADAPGVQDGAASTLTLSGKTEYEVNVEHSFDGSCTRRWGVMAMTEPRAADARPYRSVVAGSCRAVVQ
ncbi:protein kinase [Streptomyces sp. NPDC087908]|uniref:protein kinase domain-containing protein n=1 Tax=Streptomyces sp. NPDC087908 TaxID=3365820 RepID=UPI00381B312C